MSDANNSNASHLNIKHSESNIKVSRLSVSHHAEYTLQHRLTYLFHGKQLSFFFLPLLHIIYNDTYTTQAQIILFIITQYGVKLTKIAPRTTQASDASNPVCIASFNFQTAHV